MKKQRGIATGWLYLIGLIVFVGALTGLVIAWKSYTDGLIQEGYDRGRQEIEAKYAKRDNDQLRIANAEIQRLQNAARAAELEGTKRLAAIATQREKERQNAKVQHERDLAAVRAGTLVLRDPGQIAACAPVGDSGPGPEAGATAAQRDGTQAGGLSREATEFLFGEANRADDVVAQLASAQAVIVQDRITCNAGP